MDPLLKTICEALSDKKGENITIINLAKIDGAIADYFVIASAESTVQVGSLADNVEKETFDKLREKVLRIQGKENGLWIAMDYGNVMVHTMQTEMRDFYKIEDLWSDADITKYED